MKREKIAQEFARRMMDASDRGDDKKAAYYKEAFLKVQKAKSDDEANDIAWETIGRWERAWARLFW
jgi:hypothetical protein